MIQHLNQNGLSHLILQQGMRILIYDVIMTLFLLPLLVADLRQSMIN